MVNGCLYDKASALGPTARTTRLPRTAGRADTLQAGLKAAATRGGLIEVFASEKDILRRPLCMF